MFALLLPSRPLLSPTTISQTQYAFTIPSTPPFSHLAVFLLPDATLPPDAGATVWIQLPSSSEFKLLGALAVNKPSAIYRIRTSGTTTDAEGDVMLDDETPPSAVGGGGGDVVVGVSIEPLASVEQQIADLRARNAGALTVARKATTTTPDTKVLAQRIIGNAFNFLSSFGGDTIPLKAFQEWWKKFEGRVERDPGFLEREQG